MAYTPQNFSSIGYQAPTDQGYGDLFSRILQGYAGGYLPQQLEQRAIAAKNEEQAALNAQQMAPLERQQLELANAYKQAELPYVGQLAERKASQPYSDLGGTFADYNSVSGSNPEQAELFRQMLEQKARFGSAGSTEKERVAEMINNQNIPEELKKVYRDLFSIPAKEARQPITQFRPQAQNFYRKLNQSYLDEAKGAVKASATLDELEKLILQNPGISEYLEQAFTAKQDPGLIDQLVRKGLDKNKIATIEIANKLGSQLIADSAASFSGKGLTDARQELLQLIKPSARNTDKSNLFIIDNLRRMLAPDIQAYDDILSAVQNDEVYKPKKKEYQGSQSSPSTPSSGNTVKMRSKDGRIFNVPADQVEAVKTKLGGVIVDG